MSGRKLRRRREIERAVGFAIRDSTSARDAAVAFAAILHEGKPAHIEDMTDEGRALLHDQFRQLIGLPPVRRVP